MPDFNRLDEIRRRKPLLHCISNMVSINDCANIALAIGASPMMAAAREEVDEITAASAATVLNTGTPTQERYDLCRLWLSAAAQSGQPVILDPVGVGASSWRLRNIQDLLSQACPTLIRVNLGEAQALCGETGREQGVDSLSSATPAQRITLAEKLAKRYRTTVLLTGPCDLVHNGSEAVSISGGSDRIGAITGTGDMLSVLCGAFSAVEPDTLQAAALAAAFWKLCAERAETAAAGHGIGEFRIRLFDAASCMTPEELKAGSRMEVIR